MKKVLVTGAAGFVGSHLCDSYLRAGCSVIGLDNMTSGYHQNLEYAHASDSFAFVQADISNLVDIKKYFSGVDLVCHMAANADIRGGLETPSLDLQQNTIATHNVLEAMRASNVKQIVFASSAAMLGEPSEFPTSEFCPLPIQTSLYGASKLACEGLITAYCEGFGFEGYIFRFVSLLGPRYAHGHVIDFVKQLRADPSKLVVLGDGSQNKSYLHIDDCINAIMLVERRREAVQSKHNVAIYNLGTSSHITVKESASIIADEMGLCPLFEFGNKKRGWVGDNPFVFLDNHKITSRGWKPEFSIEAGIRDTVKWLMNFKNQHLL